MPQLSLTLFGAPQVEVDGKPIEISVRKVLALLLYLAVTGKSHTRDALATLLWPGYGQSDARANLRRTLSDLKRALPGDWLSIDRQTAGLRQDASLWVDVVKFRALVAKAGLDADDQTTNNEQLSTLEAAVDLYSGEFLAGFTLPDAPEFDVWQSFEGDALRHIVDMVRAALAEDYAARGVTDRALHYARQRLALDPLHEPAHRQLIHLYAQAGQQAAAVRQYQQCVHILLEELGVPPSEETVELYRQIQEEPKGPAAPGFSGAEGGEEASVPVALEPSYDVPAERRHNLPTQLTPLFGRDQEQEQICQLLTDPEIRLVTIAGAGGMGKTRLAQEVGMALLDMVRDGVFFVPLAPLRRSQDMVTAIAEALDFPFQPDQRSPRQQLLDYLRRKQMLLVLDNCEHLLDGIELVRDILAAAADVIVLATSRERLNLTGEAIFGLDGIDYASGPDPVRSDAVRLFLHSADLGQPDYQPTDDDQAQIARICRLVQGMPLGILLAVTWMELLSPRQIAEQIARNLDFLESDLRDLPNRQRSLRAVFDHSWALLAEEEQMVFSRLSVFQGSFSLDAGQEVADASLRQLMALINKSLLVRTGSDRFEMHELLHQYGAEQLAGSDVERKAAHDRHAAYYLGWLHRLTPDLHSQQQQAVMEEMEIERENVRLAWEWALDAGQRERVAGAVASLGDFLEWYGRYEEGADVFGQAVVMLTGDESAAGRRTSVHLLTRQAAYQRILGHRSQSEQLLAHAETLLREPPLAQKDVRREQAEILRERAELIYVSDGETAASLGHESLVLSKQVGDSAGMAKDLFLLGANAYRRGHNREAELLLRQSLTIRRSLGSPKEVAFSLSKLGYSILSQGRIDEADLLIREGHDLFQKFGDRSGRARALRDLAGLHAWQGRPAQAEALYVRTRMAYEEMGDKRSAMETAINLFGQRLAVGKYEEAEIESTAVLALAREAGYRWAVGESLECLGQVALVVGKAHEARSFLNDGEHVFEESGSKRHQRLHAYLSLAARALGERENARAHLVKAVAAILPGEDSYGLLHLFPPAALLKADMGDLGHAAELDALVRRYPIFASNRWWWDVARSQVAALVKSLPAEEITRAEERGRSQDLKAVAAELLTELG